MLLLMYINGPTVIVTCTSVHLWYGHLWYVHLSMVCTPMFIAGRKKIQQSKFFLFVFPLKISLQTYVLSWPKLNFGRCFTFENIFKVLFQWKNKYFFLDCWGFFPAINATVFSDLDCRIVFQKLRFLGLKDFIE